MLPAHLVDFHVCPSARTYFLSPPPAPPATPPAPSSLADRRLARRLWVQPLCPEVRESQRYTKPGSESLRWWPGQLAAPSHSVRSTSVGEKVFREREREEERRVGTESKSTQTLCQIIAQKTVPWKSPLRIPRKERNTCWWGFLIKNTEHRYKAWNKKMIFQDSWVFWSLMTFIQIDVFVVATSNTKQKPQEEQSVVY